MELHHRRPVFSELATELLTKILSELNVGDLTRCKRVCRRLNELVITDLSLLYKMELDLAGMIDGPAGGADLRVRLERLRARNEAWDMGLPLHTVMLQSPDYSTSVWQCTGGFFLYEEGTTADNMQLKLHRPAYPDLPTSVGLQGILRTLSAWRSSGSSTAEIRSGTVNPEEDMVAILLGHTESE
ncbi:hypothetical protein K466DRAFT_602698 [Polyporus arcularius HHB13444]|uniref:F-box domain-containing protein n=1 Tax=Polyporus arcularius HHB13444 TaxID=1314778 RepID=A0A5C3P1W7_9APHY|nr:hypothetical protein K466DRAFT_602698 [Polyporus arcularius HHB13444]